MADVTPDDVFLSRWREQTQPRIDFLQPGDPSLASDPQSTVAGAAWLTSPWIYAVATVTVHGAPGEDIGLWRFGFIQLRFITDDWTHYHNEIPTDGSLFMAMDRPPSRRQPLCRDAPDPGLETAFRRFPYIEPVIFYDPETPLTQLSGWWGARVAAYLPIGTRLPFDGKLVFSVFFSDQVNRHYALNQHTKKGMILNLYSLQYAGAFATMFAAQKGPNRPIVVLRSFQWNVRWRAHFGMNAGANVQLPPRRGDVMDMNISHVVKGAPNDARFQGSVLDARLPNCNALRDHANANPVILESDKWEDWDVRH